MLDMPLRIQSNAGTDAESSKEKLLGRKDARASREVWLTARRDQLHSRMRRRRRRDRTRKAGGPRPPTSLF